MNDYLPGSPIAKLAAELVAEFGDGWSVDTEASFVHGVYIDGPDVRLFVRNAQYGGPTAELVKLEVSGSVPTSVPIHRHNAVRQGLDWGKVGVSATRPAGSIREDIERRLLATARAAFAGALEREASDAVARAARHALRDQLAALLPDPRVEEEDDLYAHSQVTNYGAGADGLHSEWWFSHDGTRLNVKLSGLTPTQARQIAVLLYRKTR